MDLFEKISADIKSAMLAKDKVRLETLRGIKKEFLEEVDHANKKENEKKKSKEKVDSSVQKEMTRLLEVKALSIFLAAAAMISALVWVDS